MKTLFTTTLLVVTLSVWCVAQRPRTQVEVQHGQTTVQTLRPQSGSGAVRPSTVAVAEHPTSGEGAVRARTEVSASYPQTTQSAVYPQTTEHAVYPSTTVEVIHPQTDVQVLHPQTEGMGGEGVASALADDSGAKNARTSFSATTSMSNFKQKQAKDFAAADKGVKMGGGNLNLGNATADQAAKDSANQEKLMGKLNNQNMDVDLKQNKISGLENAFNKAADKGAKGSQPPSAGSPQQPPKGGGAKGSGAKGRGKAPKK